MRIRFEASPILLEAIAIRLEAWRPKSEAPPALKAAGSFLEEA